MNTTHVFEAKKIPEVFDLAVVGGGLAGVMASVAAAREGLRVILIEKYGFLGGAATAGLVHPFMPYWEKGSNRPANAGLFKSLLERIHALGGNDSPTSGLYMEEFMKLALDRLVREYPSIKVLFHALLTEVDVAGGTIGGITVSTVSGTIKIKANAYIDATGNGDLFAFAGFAYKQGRELDGLCQPMTLNFRLGNVDWSRIDQPKMQQLYKEFQKEGKFINPREDVLIFRMPEKSVMHLNTTRIVGRNPVDVEEYGASEMEAREQVYEMYRFMKENIEGMENCFLMMSAPELGIRESRRVVGRYEITADDITEARKFDDRIARGTYEIDIHNPAGSGTYHKGVPENDYYTIPYRALLPADSVNMIVAGRPISSTHEAHSSFRIMPITSCIGEAAGVAVSLMKKYDCPAADVPMQELQDILTSRGALI